MKRPLILLLLLPALLCAQESPFKDADDAYAQGKLRMAEKLYQEIAISHPDTQVQADAFLRLAWVQYSLNERQQCLYGLEKALFLNPKLTVDPNIYNQEFFRIYEMAILRRTLVSASSTEDPLGERPVMGFGFGVYWWAFWDTAVPRWHYSQFIPFPEHIIDFQV